MRTRLALLFLTLFLALSVRAADPAEDRDDEVPMQNWAISFDRVVRKGAADSHQHAKVDSVASVPTTFIPIVPCRLVDTRLPAGTYGGPSFTADSSREFNIPANACGVPLAAAYSLNITATRYKARGFITVFPTGSTLPGTSTLNFGDPPPPPALPPSVANGAIVPADENGSVSVYAFSATDIVIDINGYFVTGVITGVNAAAPLSVTGTSNVTVGVNPGSITAALIGSEAITTGAIKDGNITAAKIGTGQVVKSINTLNDAVSITGVNGATVTTAGSTIQVSAPLALPSGAVVFGLPEDTTLINAGFTERSPTDQQMWSPTTITAAPSARRFHSAVWTGTRMIIWGGATSSAPGAVKFQNGALYDPATDTWTPTSITASTPAGRELHTAVWTGTKMIVWGGQADNNVSQNTGGIYDPSDNSWVATDTTAAPGARVNHTAVWTGTEMIVWGGNLNPPNVNLRDGGRFNPSTNTWLPVTLTGAPSIRDLHTAVWTGTTMIVWGGRTNVSFASALGDGGRYNPATDNWDPIAIATSGAPIARSLHTAVPLGEGMIVWGGLTFASTTEATGGIYVSGNGVGQNQWTATPAIGAPRSRASHTAVMTPLGMVVWGGTHDSGFTQFENTGALLRSSDSAWIPLELIGAPDARVRHTMVYTGKRMIVWGGVGQSGNLGTGGQWGFLSIYRKN